MLLYIFMPLQAMQLHMPSCVVLQVMFSKFPSVQCQHGNFLTLHEY